MMQSLLRDPLLHFLLAGAAVFGAWYALNPADASSDPHIIRVNRAALLQFVQFRTRSFDSQAAARRLDLASDEAFAELVREYAREEALYRAAQEMGLDADDYVMRQRSVQKVEYLAEGVTVDIAPPERMTLQAYLSAHAERYRQPETITFTHVFFSTRARSPDEARQLATAALRTLNAEAVPFAQATRFGERFAYQVNYVERMRDDIAGHFGTAMADALFALTPDASTWQGPFGSPHGSHLVLVTQRTSARDPALSEIEDRVRVDWLAEQARRRKEAFIERLLDGYTIDVDPALREAAP